ncbi:hypothetical protein EDC04DRAFT_2585826, partial [Pisolithus marmoratus]
KKIEWFDWNPDWCLEDRVEAHQIVQTCWEESYSNISQSTELATCHDKDGQPKRSKWAVDDDDDIGKHPTVVPDSIEAYLDLPPITKSEVKATGGVLKYWENCCTTQPWLS